MTNISNTPRVPPRPMGFQTRADVMRYSCLERTTVILDDPSDNPDPTGARARRRGVAIRISLWTIFALTICAVTSNWS